MDESLGGWSWLEVEEDQSSQSGPANQEIPPARSTGPNCPAAHSAHCPPTDRLTHHTPSPTLVRLRQFPNPPIQIPSSAPHSRVMTRVDETTSRRGCGRAEAEDQGRRWETGGRGRLRGSQQQQGLGRPLERSATQPDRAAARTRSLPVSVRGGGGGQGRVTDAVLVWPRGCRWPGAPESARGPVEPAVEAEPRRLGGRRDKAQRAAVQWPAGLTPVLPCWAAGSRSAPHP